MTSSVHGVVEPNIHRPRSLVVSDHYASTAALVDEMSAQSIHKREAGLGFGFRLIIPIIRRVFFISCFQKEGTACTSITASATSDGNMPGVHAIWGISCIRHNITRVKSPFTNAHEGCHSGKESAITVRQANLSATRVGEDISGP